MSSHSKACCTIAPVIAKDYKEKGNFVDVAGTKTYVTGPALAKKAIVVIYDVFGVLPQVVQGADILATSDEHNAYRVFMPDFFGNNAADVKIWPPDTPEKQKAVADFLAGPGKAETNIAQLAKIMAELKLSNSHITSWGIVGFCWGGKMTALVTGPGTEFTAAAACHPAMVDPEDATKIIIPYASLPSKEEKVEDVEAFHKALKPAGLIERFDDMPHGWMTARGDLENEPGKGEYIRGYKTVLEFFAQHV